MSFQIGQLQYPDKTDPSFDDYWEAVAEAENRNLKQDDSVWAVWTGQKEGSELMAIIYEGKAYTR